MNHTKGPWKHTEPWAIIEGPNHEEICAVHAAGEGENRRIPKGTAQANANLIAAAPSMYSALWDLLDCIEEAHETDRNSYEHEADCSYCLAIAAAQNAISKANGKTRTAANHIDKGGTNELVRQEDRK